MGLQERLTADGATFDAEVPELVRHYGQPANEAARAWQGGLQFLGGPGNVRLSGPDRVTFLNGQCTNDVAAADSSVAVRAVLTTPKGRVIDVAHVQSVGDALELAVSPVNVSAVLEHLQAKIVMDDCTAELATGQRLRLTGAACSAAAATVFGVTVQPHDEHLPAAVGAFDGTDVPVCGVAGPGGFALEALVGDAQVEAVWTALTEAGLTPIGADAWHHVCVEQGLPTLGREMGDHANPLECGLESAVSFTKGCYVGQEIVARLHNYKKVKRRLVGLRFPADADPAVLDEVFWDLLRVGNVTSAVHSPRLGATVALALVKSDYTKPDTPIYSVRDSERIEGVVCELPFNAPT